MLAIADARLEGPATLDQPLSAVDPGVPIAARVTVEGATEAPGPTVGVLAELGFGPVPDGEPETDYEWTAMAFDSDVDGADRLVGTVRPDAAGPWNVAAPRVARRWFDLDLRGSRRDRARPVGLPSRQRGHDRGHAGRRPGPARGAGRGRGGHGLARVPDAGVGRRSKRRTCTATRCCGARPRAARTSGSARRPSPTFTDDGVDQGSSYVYVIVAVDTSFNRSAESAEVAAAAEAREVAVTFTVTVPPNTPADDTVYIAGDFQDWDPGGTPMERVDAATWSITLPFTEGEPPQYKYTRGTWEAVEKDAACGELANRTVTVAFGEGGTADVADTVEKWRDVDSCP